MNVDSPFEQWRLKYMRGTAASREIMELLALAFEGGRVAEREACADLVFKMAQLPKYEQVWLPLHHAQSAIRARGNHGKN